jgi:pimeloyl-ACP methyl ester carboxylesterase
MEESRIEPVGIPTRLYDPGHHAGSLLLGHGGGELGKDSDRFVELCRRYATETGLAVACIDAIDHGERRPTGPLEPGVPSRWHSSAAPQMVADWQQVSAALAAVGPTVAYVGFSMGAMFGLPTVAAMPSIRAAVFVVGGVPEGEWLDDPPLEGLLMDAAAHLGRPAVLMVNMSRDELFPASGSVGLFNAIPAQHKKLVFRDGGHSDWDADAIGETIAFINGALSTTSAV